MIARAVFTVVIVAAFGRAVCADPIRAQPSRSIFGHVSITDASFLGATDFLGQNTTAAGSFDTNGSATAATDIASLSIAASQQTTVDTAGRHFFGSGSVSVSDLFGEVQEVNLTDVASQFVLDFVLSRAMAYQFGATLSGTGEVSVYAFLEGTSGWRVWPDGIGTPVHREGLLMPGSYTFLASAETPPGRPVLSSSGAFDIDFTLSEAPVPEPTSIALVSTGLIGAAVRRRRRTHGRGFRTR